MDKKQLPVGGYVKVSVNVPKPLHDFMDKFAALEGYHAEDWYEGWIRADFEGFLDELNGLDVDMKNLIECNDLKETLESRNPSFVNRIFHKE